MKKVLLILVFSAFLLSTSQAVKIEITNPTLRPFRLFVSPYSGKEALNVYSQIVNNLKILSNFEFLDSRDAADYELVMNEEAGTFSATVTNLKSGESSTFKVKPFKSDSLGNAYLLTDKIYEKITQTPGIFSARVVFSMSWNGVRQIFISDIMGKRLQKLTANKTDSIAPKISADRKFIAYTNYRRENGTSIRLINLETLEDSVAFASTAMNVAGGFNGDGSAFYFSSYDGKSSRIYEYSMKSKNASLLYTSRARIVSPVTTYNAEQIAFVSDELGGPQVFTLSLKTKSMKRITYNHSYATSPSFTRYGTHYVYLGQAAGRNKIFISSLDGSDFIAIGHGDKGYEDPIWMSNERFILSHSGSGANSTLYLIDIPTQKFIKLFDMPATISYLSAG
jgi:Tol biopolymer transport system component